MTRTVPEWSQLEELLIQVRDFHPNTTASRRRILDALIKHEVYGATGHDVDHYTTSIDAAISLLPDGALGRGDSLTVNTGANMGGYNYTASIHINGKRHRVSARTMPGAICAAVIESKIMERD